MRKILACNAFLIVERVSSNVKGWHGGDHREGCVWDRVAARGKTIRRIQGYFALTLVNLALDGGPLSSIESTERRRSSMKRICDLLREKGRDIWALEPDATVYEAIDLMAEKGVGALLVMERDRLVGIVSERDYARKVILKGKLSRETSVSEIMSYPVICVPQDLTIEQTMALMTERHIRHLPVMDEDTVIGVISIGDVVRAIIEVKEFYIQQLTTYIASA
jgi:CBS domain-containing protein